MDFAAKLAALRTALDAITTAYNAHEEAGEGDYHNPLRWIKQDLEALVRNAWVDSQVFGQAIDAIKQNAESAKLPEDAASVVSGLTTTLESLDHEFASTDAFKYVVNAAVKSLAEAKPGGNLDSNSTDNSAAESTTSAVTNGIIFAEQSQPDKHIYRMLVIREGLSGNRVMYPGDILQESASRLNDRPIYIDHPENVGTPEMKARSITSKVGWWSDSTYAEGIDLPDGTKTNGIIATANLITPENSPAPWFPGFVREALTRGKPDMVGISILASGRFTLRRSPEHGIYKEANHIAKYLSADAVAEPGAGGQVYAIAASKGTDKDVKFWETATAEDVAKASYEQCMEGWNLREDLRDAIKSRIATLISESENGKSGDGGDDEDEDEKKRKAAAKAKADAEAAESLRLHAEGSKPNGSRADDGIVAEANKVLARVLEREAKSSLREILAESKLPASVKTSITEEVNAMIAEGSIPDDAKISTLVKRYEAIAESAIAASGADLPGKGNHGILSAGTMIPPGGIVREGDMITPIEQASLAMDQFFGVPIAENKRGKFPMIHSFAEFYRGVTGDVEVRGYYDKDRAALGDFWESSTFAEALPSAANIVGGGTITMQSLLGTSMNRALFNFYQGQPKWWSSITTRGNLSNMKQQDRVRLHNFGSLTQRSTHSTEEYTELLWGETAETYQPRTYGNLVTVGRIAIINDDLRGIQAIPRLLAQSAIVTINEHHSALFTANSGNGPVLADTVQVFNAAGHQGNRITQSLNRTSSIAARRVIMKMQNDAGKRIGLMPKTLLVPIDLEDVGYELIRSERTPGSANNEPNILSDGERGLSNLVVVPNWTNEANWYMMADPAQLTSIETGFLFGREDPEFFEQTTPSVGMVFTNDVMAFKIRHDYGASWLDYRGAVGSIPS